MPKPPAKRRRRPKGSATHSLPAAEAQLSRCKKCDSTDRGPYRRVTETAHNGQKHGQPYTHIIRRWTACAACGQARIDITHENRCPLYFQASTESAPLPNSPCP